MDAGDLERGGCKFSPVVYVCCAGGSVHGCGGVEELRVESEGAGLRSTRLQDADATELITNIYVYHTARNDFTALDPLTRRVCF